MEHLQLARRRVADVDFDAAIVGREPDAAAREIRQFEHRILDPGEERVALARREAGIVDLRRAVVLQQQVDVGLRLLAPRGQQTIAGFVMVGAAFCCEPGEALAVDDLEPVFAAGVEHVQPQVDPLREAVQDVEVERRRGRQAEDVRRGGQPRARRGVGPHRRHRVEEGHRRMAAVGAEIAGDAPPQRGLPALVGPARGVEVVDPGGLAGKPRREPVGPVGQVVLEQRRGARRELVAHHVVRVAQVARERRMPGDERRLAEDPQHAPGEHRRGEGRHFRDGHHVSDLPPQPLRQKGEPHVRADAEALRRGELDPASDRRAPHDDLFVNERRFGRGGHCVEERVLEVLEAVGESDLQHAGGVGLGTVMRYRVAAVKCA